MKKLKYIMGFLLVLVLITSCEDYMDTKVTSNFGDEYALENYTYVQGILMNAYKNIPTRMDRYGNNFLDAATDNAVTNNYDSNIYALGGGKLSASSNPVGVWDLAYQNMAYIHLFMEIGLDEDKVTYYSDSYDSNRDSILRYRLKGEAFFLRAYWGMELLRVYGGEAESGEILGYPIITEYMSEEEREAAFDIPRNTYEECVQQILDDCDSAIVYLPDVYVGSDDDGILGSVNIGRATDKAAYVLKSRVATYAASPAYNGGVDVQAKWERAAVLSQEAIDKADLSYSALTYNDVTGPDTETTPEDYVFRKYFNNNTGETYNLPPAYWGQGRTQPSQNLVNAFPMSNGFPITDPASGYDPQDPYSNRDPRLKNTVIYNGVNVEANGRETEVAGYILEDVIVSIDTLAEYEDVFGNITYDVDTTFKSVERVGYDGPGYHYDNTRTGYYLRKWISNVDNMLDVNNKQTDDHFNPLIRGAEAYYNLAEASIEATGTPTGVVAGCTLSAYDIIKYTRSKSMGLSTDDYLDSQMASSDNFRALIHNERRLEFAFENHRYFDLRRWMDFEKLNEPIYGMNLTTEYDVDTYEGTDPNGTSVLVEERGFDDEKYFYNPLPYDEVAKSNAIEQNKGW